MPQPQDALAPGLVTFSILFMPSVYRSTSDPYRYLTLISSTTAGGPTDDFIPDEIGLKLPVTRNSVNINDPGVFATKPGDAMTMMSTHTFINEPSGQHLEQALKYIYHHHNKQDL